MRIVLLDSFTADQGDTSWTSLRSLGELTVYPRVTAADLPAACAGAEAIITNKATLGAHLIRDLPALRYIGISATGTNIVDLEAAKAGGVAVTNVPGYSTLSVAQLVFALVLHFATDVAAHNAAVKAGHWAEQPDFCFFLRPLTELAGKTLVVVGMGEIGRAVARIGNAFGMRVLAAAVPGSTSGQARLPLPEALPQADVVTLHCPLTAQTSRLVDGTFLQRLRPEAILINTSRGGLVDEESLVAALAGGHLRGVGLDVLAIEPPAANHPLTRKDAAWASRVVITPHIGWGTVEARHRLQGEAAENLAAFVRGERRNRVA